jgi:hypothetical protein
MTYGLTFAVAYVLPSLFYAAVVVLLILILRELRTMSRDTARSEKLDRSVDFLH